MKKIPLILRSGEFTSFTSYYLESLWQQFFDIQIYDATHTYNRRSVFVVWHNSADDAFVWKLKDQGHKVAIDNLWEAASGRSDYYWIEHPNWWWWNESLWWTALGLNKYLPRKDLRYLALMQMRRYSSEREYILSKLDDLLPSMLSSCSWRHQTLPNDINDAYQGQRFMDPTWYDQSYCSVVIETTMRTDACLFVTEKSFKPLAYHHPFLSMSQPGTLKWLGSLGFETFGNLFDESYDTVKDLDHKLSILRHNLMSIDRSAMVYDPMTQEKIKHNHDLFFSVDRCRDGIIQHVINPLMHYAET